MFLFVEVRYATTIVDVTTIGNEKWPKQSRLGIGNIEKNVMTICIKADQPLDYDGLACGSFDQLTNLLLTHSFSFWGERSCKSRMKLISQKRGVNGGDSIDDDRDGKD